MARDGAQKAFADEGGDSFVYHRPWWKRGPLRIGWKGDDGFLYEEEAQPDQQSVLKAAMSK